MESKKSEIDNKEQKEHPKDKCLEELLKSVENLEIKEVNQQNELLKEKKELSFDEYKIPEDKDSTDKNKNDNITVSMTWESLGVKENIIQGLLDMGFLQPSKIQTTTFPLILKEPRSNIIAQAKNGSGKTGAFGIGILSSIDEKNKNIQAVVFAHTRELVIQIKQVLEKIAKYTKIKVKALLSGDYEFDEFGQIIVITPGHFENLFLKRNRKYFSDNFKSLKMLILDEADYMLTNEVTSKVCEKSFILFQKNKMNVQILFFSATFDQDCEKLIKKYYSQKETHRIELKKEELTLDKVKQYYQKCSSQEDKIKFIEKYLPMNQQSQRIIIFTNKRDNAVNLQKALIKRGYEVYVLMGGDMSFQERDETIEKFRKGEIQILITTNLISRGYDERLVKLVINYEIPFKILNNGFCDVDYETYLHRIGRTGRFETEGMAINLVLERRDMNNLKKIEKYYNTKIEEMKSMDELSIDLGKCVIKD